MRVSRTKVQEDQLGVLKSNKTQKEKVNEKQRMKGKENARNARKEKTLKVAFQVLCDIQSH